MKSKVSVVALRVTLLLLSSFCIMAATQAQIISRFAGNGNNGYDGDGGEALNAQLDGPIAVTTDDSGNVFIADYYGNRIRKVTPAGIISTIAGTGGIGFSGDGGPAIEAVLSGPSGLATDHAGNLYFADCHNGRVRRINREGIITTIAGSGTGGYGGNGGKATQASFSEPTSVAVDEKGNIYVADCGNNCIRKITPAGIVLPYAGNAAGAGTGTGSFRGDNSSALAAELNHPRGMSFDAAGNMFFSDCFNNRVRKVSTAGIITTVAGNGQSGYDRDGVKANVAMLNYPQNVIVDATGNLFIADLGNNRIRQVSATGIISTVAGTGQAGYTGDDGLATQAQINEPSYVTFDRSGNLLICSKASNKVRRITQATLAAGHIPILAPAKGPNSIESPQGNITTN